MEPETILLVYEFLFWLAVALLIIYGGLYLISLFLDILIEKEKKKYESTKLERK